MAPPYWRKGVASLALLLAACCTACGPYMKDRANDAKDMLEIGLTLSKKPGFAIHQDYFNYLPHGFSSVDGYFIGNGNRKVGLTEFKDFTWGVLAVGWDSRRFASFDPSDHHQISSDYVKKLKAEGKPLPTENPGWGTGAWGVKPGGPTPWPSYISCRRNVHLGFVGIYASMHPADIFDFLLGWTTLDFMGDDFHSQAAQQAAH
jgi:hypothetical protein